MGYCFFNATSTDYAILYVYYSGLRVLECRRPLLEERLDTLLEIIQAKSRVVKRLLMGHPSTKRTVFH
jgi:hypothetical protein